MPGICFAVQDPERSTVLYILRPIEQPTLREDSVAQGISKLVPGVKLYVLLHAKMVAPVHIQTSVLVFLVGRDPAALFMNVILAVQEMVERVLDPCSATAPKDGLVMTV
jgi:hypothetical protein